MDPKRVYDLLFLTDIDPITRLANQQHDVPVVDATVDEQSELVFHDLWAPTKQMHDHVMIGLVTPSIQTVATKRSLEPLLLALEEYHTYHFDKTPERIEKELDHTRKRNNFKKEHTTAFARLFDKRLQFEPIEELERQWYLATQKRASYRAQHHLLCESLPFYAQSFLCNNTLLHMTPLGKYLADIARKTPLFTVPFDDQVALVEDTYALPLLQTHHCTQVASGHSK